MSAIPKSFDPVRPAEEITELLSAWRGGDRGALDRLVPRVYGELRRVADRHLRRERSDHTLQPTALVHEAYLRLTGAERPAWRDRLHFYAVAAQVMRRILVDHARAHRAEKRGGGLRLLPLDEGAAAVGERAVELIALDDALVTLTKIDSRKARIIELHYFAGLRVIVEAVAAGARLLASGAANGQQIGPYRLERELGRGGTSTVYLARSEVGPVALKLLDRDRLDGRSVVARFEAERRALSALDHPDIGRPARRGSRPLPRCPAGRRADRHLGLSDGQVRPSPSLGVAAASAFLALIVAFAVSLALQSRRLARERDRAERIAGFLIDLFEIADPSESRGASVTAREMLDRGAVRLRTVLANEPEVRASLQETIGRVYQNLGLFSGAGRSAGRGEPEQSRPPAPRSR